MLAVLAPVAIIGCSPEGEAQQEEERQVMKVALVSRTLFNAPLWVGDARGFFRDAGIVVETEVFNDADAITEALLSGEMDIAITTPEGAILNANAGGPLRLIGANVDRPPHFLITSAPVTSIADIGGGRVGVLSATEGTSYLFVKLATDSGLAREDYELVEVGGAPTREGLLAADEIQAGLQPFPLSYRAESLGLNNLGPVSAFVPDYLFTSINVNAQTAAARRETFDAFFAALAQGLAFIESNPDQAAQDIAGPLDTSPEIARQVIDDAIQLNVFAPSMAFRTEALDEVVNGLAFSGQISGPDQIDYERALDRSFVGLLDGD